MCEAPVSEAKTDTRSVSHCKYYLVTLNRNQKKDYVSFERLQVMMQIFSKHFFDVKDYCLESHGFYKQLHAHFIIKVPFNFRYKRYCRQGKYNLHFQEITVSLERACAYLHKHCRHHCPEQIEQTKQCNYYKYHYGFSNRCD